MEVDRLVMNVPNSLNNLKTKVDDTDVGKLRSVPVDLEKLSDIVDNELVIGFLKKRKFNTLKTKVNNLEKNIFETNTLIDIN